MAEEKQGGKIITPLGWDIKRNAKGQFVPNNEQLRELVCCEEVSLGEIDTSEVTDMKGLFAYIEHDDTKNFWEGVVDWATDNNVKLDFKREDFSGISSWDTSKVTTFEWMFFKVVNFNEDISKWDTSSVTNMSGMFSFAVNFNQPLNDWDTSSVTDTNRMFAGALHFNQPLNSWDTSRVMDMSGMFGGMLGGAKNFNQPLDSWDTSKVANMSSMFRYARNFNQPLNE